MVEPADLIPVACFSDAERHTLHYPNGDVAHYFSMLLPGAAVGGGAGAGRRGDDWSCASPTRPICRSPSRARPPRAVELLLGYLRTGAFQVG